MSNLSVIDSPRWVGHGVVHKYDLSDMKKAARQGRMRLVEDESGIRPGISFAEIEPYEVVDAGYNLLCTAGVTRLWNLATNQGATQAFDATHTRVGVGDGTTAATAADTALTGSTNKYFQLVSGAGTVSTNTLQFSAVFATANGNFVWNCWGIDQGTASAGTAASGAIEVAPLLNHAVVSLGTKTSAAAWTFTVTLSLT